jgi:hypothetical protein
VAHHGFLTDASPVALLTLLFIYAMAIPPDSGALASGMTLSAQPEYRGATITLHSTVGFGLSAAGGWVVGVALDAGGGMNTRPAGSWHFWFSNRGLERKHFVCPQHGLSSLRSFL